MRGLICTCLILVMGLSVGCVPTRVVWSPDGTRAAVLGDDGLHVCDLAGKVSGVLVPTVRCVGWMPDGKRVVVQKKVTLGTWKELAAALPADAKEIAANTQEIAKVRATLLAAAAKPGETPDAFQKDIGDTDVDAGAKVERTIFYLRDQEENTLKPKLGGNWEYLTKLTLTENVVQLYDVSGNAAKEGAVLSASVEHADDDLYELRVSPTGRAVAVARSRHDAASLVVYSTDEGKGVCALGASAQYPDWTPDGKYLVYMKPSLDPNQSGTQMGNKDVQWGTLLRQQLTDASGALIAQDKLPGAEALAGLVFDGGSRIRVTKDGRIFFLTAELTLPAGVGDVNTELTLFSIDPEKQAGVMRVVPRSIALGDALQFFEVSPSGKYVSMPFKDGRVLVLNVAQGQTELVQTETTPSKNNEDLQLATVPVWRTDDELTFVRPREKTTAHEVVRYSMAEKKASVLSTGWGKEIGEWIVGKEEPATTPTAGK